MPCDKVSIPAGSGLLMRLLRDKRAATLPIMAAAIFPLAGLVGGSIDMGRMYLTKARLQQACDAGALGGRKVMAAGTWAANTNAANTAANRFFDANFGAGDYGTGTRTRSFSEAGGIVTGTASAIVPMTLMRIFGSTEKSIAVTCSAQLKLPNTDIMFVLDNSGSMSRNADDVEANSDATSRIVALRAATKCFYEVVALIDTPEDCGFTPTGGTAPGVQIRFGFVNYNSMVNVGRQIPASALADNWTYQSRTEVPKSENYQYQTGTTTTWTNGSESQDGADTVKNRNDGTYVTYTGSSSTGVTQAACTVPADSTTMILTGSEGGRLGEVTTTVGNTRTTTWTTEAAAKIEFEYTKSWAVTNTRVTPNTGTCTRKRRTPTMTRVRHYKQVDTSTTSPVYETRTRQVFDVWNYAPTSVNVSAFKTGATSITLPIGNVDPTTNRATNKVITWDGCIEERRTAVGGWPTFTSITANQWDLDIDMAATADSWPVPANGPQGSRWGPSLKGIVWARGIAPRTWYQNDWNSRAIYPATRTATNYAAGDETSPFNNAEGPNSYTCPTESRALRVWPATPPTGQLGFSDYVDTLVPGGNTFYDEGLIWGARFLSPTGLFASTNATTPSGGAIERHIIFMTDGNVQTQHYNRSPYGLPWFDRRENGTGSAPSHDDIATQNQTRLDAICTKVKTMPSTTLWVVGFGAAVSAVDTTRLKNCAVINSNDYTRYLPARTNADLKSQFRKIAATISQLKLTS